MRTILFITILLSLVSCVREEVKISDLDIDGSALQYKIAVEGFISTENTNCRVMLYQPSSINNLNNKITMPNAIVVLREGENVSI